MLSKTIVPVLALSLTTTGCFFLGDEETKFLEADDVRLDLPESITMRDGDATQVRGDVHRTVEWTAREVNAWVTQIVESSAKVVAFLDDVPATSREGNVRIYGPYDDDDGRDLSWLVRLENTKQGARFEVFVGARGAKAQADMDALMTGELQHDGRERSGGFTMDFDAVEKHPAMKGADAELTVLGGAVAVTFTRDVDTEAKTIELDFAAASVEHLGYLDDDHFYSDDLYRYARDADGAGSFHLAAYGEWDDLGWSGPEQEKMVLQAVWTADGAGRTRGTITEVDGVGDMKFGDLALDECFGADGYLTWRQLNEPYALEAPGYNFGAADTCVISADALEG